MTPILLHSEFTGSRQIWLFRLTHRVGKGKFMVMANRVYAFSLATGYL